MTSGESRYPTRYCIVLSIKHPSLDPAKITAELDIEPTNCWAAGKERTTPAGTPLPGTNVFSFWTASEEAVGEKGFFATSLDWISRLECSAEFIREVVASGGVISIVIQLFGKGNIGDEMEWSGLARLVALKINLGIELFPESS